MLEQNKKDKTKLLIVGLFCFVLIISMLGYTYAFFGLDDKTSSIVGAEAECYTVNYTKGQTISGNLTSGIDYTGGRSTDILMYTESGCGLMYGTLYLTTINNGNETSIDFTSGALKYSVVVNDKVVSEGVVSGEENQVIYTNFILSDIKTIYQVYIWLDEELEEYIQIGDTFSGFIHADAILSSNFTKYVLKGSEEVTSGEDPFLGIEDIKRNEIESIEFVKILKEEIPENSIGEYDVSIAPDNSVLLYYTDDNNNNLYEVKIGTETGTTIASSGAYLFSYLSNLTDINLTNLDTSRVTTMENMFDNCIKLTTINLSNLNTSNVTNMIRMFSHCKKLTSLDLSNFKTLNVTDMAAMFQRCISLKSLDLSNFNTTNVSRMRNMFFGCYNLTDLNLSNFKTNNVKDMAYMFANDNGESPMMLTNISGLEDFDTSNVETMAGMFQLCGSLEVLRLGNFNTEKVTDMKHMFHGCYSLKTIFVSNDFKTSGVSTSNSSYMFTQCDKLVGGKGTKFDLSRTNKAYAKIDGGTANPGYFTDASEL